jgi:glycosyltransferase involved in cell wall biosynthesis
MTMPKVSVIIPAYNAADYIEASLGSVLSQDYSNIEIIVIDDGSTDLTEELLTPYKEKIIYKKKINGGLGSARNLGHSIATGEYVAWLDADDIAAPNRISSQVEQMLRNPDLVLVSSDFSAFGVRVAPVTSYIHQYYKLINAVGGLGTIYSDRSNIMISGKMCDFYSGNILNNIVFGNFVHPPTALFKISALLGLEPLREDVKSSVDWEFFTRLARQGSFGYISAPLLKYRLSETQISSTKVNPIKVTSNIMRIFEEIAHHNSDVITANVERYRVTLSEMQLDVADALCDSDNQQAKWLLEQSISNNRLNFACFKVAIKIHTPQFFIDIFRIFKGIFS